MNRIAFPMLLLVACLSSAQDAPKPTPQTVVSVSDLLTGIQPRELGPTTMGGRVNGIAVVESDPKVFYVATASGGLWKTENSGLTMTPVFYKEKSVALGAVAVSQSDPNIVWVGTGENNSRNSTSWGDGVYKSIDGGKTWTNQGLGDTRHIGEIVIHPTNPDIVYVAALGHLWGANDERGVYKTEDGGKTWKRMLFENERAGIVSLKMSPADPDTLLAASYERMRWPYKWASGGPSTALYRTTDGGKSWKKAMKGIPEGDTGRIGLSFYRKDPKIVVATIEKGTKKVEDKDVPQGGVFRSTDGGQSWTKVNDLNPRPFYFSQPHQDPVDENKVYLVAVTAYVSENAGKEFKAWNMSVHVDHHALWIDPKDNKHILVGNDGGVGQTWDGGKTWQHVNTMRIGQFYAVSVDMRKPYWVYGGLQDNGSWAGPTQTRHGGVIVTDWFTYNGGDGFYTANDPEDWRIAYGESQGGFMTRVNLVTGERASIRPRAAEGAPPLRFNWSTPFMISPHANTTLYAGSQYLHRSVNRGKDWETISPDLTTNDKEKQNPKAGVTPEDTGAERHTTITTISESSLKMGVLWVGTDDGKVHVTKDGGKNWTDLTGKFPGVPQFTWVSRVRASRYVEGRCYVTFDGHRNNDYKPYVFVTEDFGDTWTEVTANLPQEGSTYVITEGQKNPDLLIVGTEFGLYFSLNRGLKWVKYTTGEWPTVRVDDLVIHPRDLDLVVGTHGRSIWILPIAPLEEMTPEVLDKDAHVFRPQTMYTLGYVGTPQWTGDAIWRSPNTEPDGDIYYYIKEKTEEKVKIVITTPDGGDVAELEGVGTPGLNKVTWKPTRRRPATAGDYSVVLRVGDKEYRTMLHVEDVSVGNDPNAVVTPQGQ